MCGIIAAVSSEEEVAPILLEGLKREEYRGYDSAGVALLNGKGTITVRKDVGRVRTARAEVQLRGASAGGSGSRTRGGRPTAASPRRTRTRTSPARARSR